LTPPSSGGFRGGRWGRSPLPSRKNFRFFPAKANENEFLPPQTVLKKLFLLIIASTFEKIARPFQNPRSATDNMHTSLFSCHKMFHLLQSVADLGFWKGRAIFSKVGAMIGKNHFLRTV